MRASCHRGQYVGFWRIWQWKHLAVSRFLESKSLHLKTVHFSVCVCVCVLCMSLRGSSAFSLVLSSPQNAVKSVTRGEKDRAWCLMCLLWLLRTSWTWSLWHALFIQVNWFSRLHPDELLGTRTGNLYRCPTQCALSWLPPSLQSTPLQFGSSRLHLNRLMSFSWLHR